MSTFAWKEGPPLKTYSQGEESQYCWNVIGDSYPCHSGDLTFFTQTVDYDLFGGRSASYMQPLVSVAIVNYNGETVIETCLASVTKTDYPMFEIIVFDNGSTDKGPELVKKFLRDHQHIRLIENAENVGPAEGRNLAIGASRGQYVILLHSDTVVDPGWMGKLLVVLESDPSIGAAQCKILLYDHPDRFDSVGVKMDAHGCPISIGKRTGFLEKPSHAAFDENSCELDRGQYDNIREVFATTFCATAVRKSVLSYTGSFDPDLFGSLEDIDLSWRIRLAGYKIVCVPGAIVYHRGGIASTRQELRNDMSTAFSRNRLIMLIKNYSFGNLLNLAPSITAWYFSIMMFCLLFDRRLFLNYTTGIIQNLLGMKKTIKKRNEVQRRRRTSDKEVSKRISGGCITIDYKLRPWIMSRQ